jgi:hypothetical protein
MTTTRYRKLSVLKLENTIPEQAICSIKAGPVLRNRILGRDFSRHLGNMVELEN